MENLLVKPNGTSGMRATPTTANLEAIRRFLASNMTKNGGVACKSAALIQSLCQHISSIELLGSSNSNSPQNSCSYLVFVSQPRASIQLSPRRRTRPASPWTMAAWTRKDSEASPSQWCSWNRQALHQAEDRLLDSMDPRTQNSTGGL